MKICVHFLALSLISLLLPLAHANAVTTKMSSNSDFFSQTAWQMLWSCLFVVLLIIALAYLLKRLQQRGFNRRSAAITVIATMPIGAKERLVVVEVGQTQILLGITAQNVQTLHVLDEPLCRDETPSNQYGQSFQKLMTKIRPKEL